MDMPYKCINKNGWMQARWGAIIRFIFGRYTSISGPRNGDVVTVIGEYYEEGILFFHLLEWPSERETDGWQADQFIPYYEDEETEWAIEATKKVLSMPPKWVSESYRNINRI